MLNILLRKNRSRRNGILRRATAVFGIAAAPLFHSCKGDGQEKSNTEVRHPVVVDESPASRESISLTVKVKSRFKNEYAEKVVPVIEASCTAGGCHSQSDQIDLRSFPYAAEGSYALDAIRSELGSTPDATEVQRRLVASLVSAMKTDYMPPAWGDAKSVTSVQIEYFETWLAGDLKMEEPPFTGDLIVTGMKDTEVICKQTWRMNRNILDTVVDLKLCRESLVITYMAIDLLGDRIGEGEVGYSELLKLEKWSLDF